ncbi:MAG: alanine racemase [Gammaproteobacteria bacterium]|nr:alanine racemase [Gammaproteobacteria bacterium]
MNAQQKHIQVEISRSAFADNIHFLRQSLAPAKICVVMKANAYGHGLEHLLDSAIGAGADYLGICTNDEAATIRRRHPSHPILRLRTALPDELEESVTQLHVEEMVGSVAVAEFLAGHGRRRSSPVPVHIKIDTGMGRTGFLADDQAGMTAVCGMDGLRVRGVMTHLPSADGTDLGSTRDQLEQFRETMSSLESVLPKDVLVHSHNSAASMRLPELRGGMVRVGAACYGVRTSSHFSNPPELRPVMSIKTRIMEIRDVPEGRTIGYGSLYKTTRPSRIATVPVGFGEGYPRGLFNKGIVLINGQRCPVVGRVSLNVTTIDITDLSGDVRWGDEVVLVGRQESGEMTFEELADLFGGVHTEINLMAGFYNKPRYID